MKKLVVIAVSLTLLFSGIQNAQAMSKKNKGLLLGVVGGLTVGYLGSKLIEKNKEENHNNNQPRCHMEDVYKRDSNGRLIPVQVQVCD